MQNVLLSLPLALKQRSVSPAILMRQNRTSLESVAAVVDGIGSLTTSW